MESSVSEPVLQNNCNLHDGMKEAAAQGDTTGQSIARRSGGGRGEKAERSQQERKTGSRIEQLKVASVNARSLLCDKNPDLLDSARSLMFRQEMKERAVHVAMVQETKTEAKWVRDCEDFVAAAASPLHSGTHGRIGGLQVLVATQKGLEVLWVREYSYRLLVVGLRWNTEKWAFLNAYAPTSAAPYCDFEHFWEQLMEAIPRESAELIFSSEISSN
eukprot:5190162-Amphidinium_carterae.2